MRLTLTLLCSAMLVAFATSCKRSNSCAAVEKAHGLKLPSSARNCQILRSGGLVDHGILSLFELDQGDLWTFTNQLAIKSMQLPTRDTNTNPCINGWNVWPTNSKTFVPGNEELSHVVMTWVGQALPVEMLSCKSPKGDWLHVEIWKVETHALVKLYTDWH